MRHLTVFPIALCVAFAGCQMFKKSSTWEKVVRTKTDVYKEADPAQSYAEQMHAKLLAERVPHRVVTYQFNYSTPLSKAATGQSTAIVYRDDSSPRTPWWLVEDRTRRPIWLPNGELNEQLKFYARGQTEIVDVKDYPPSPRNLAEVEAERERRPTAVTRITPVRHQARVTSARADSRMEAINRTVTKPIRKLLEVFPGGAPEDSVEPPPLAPLAPTHEEIFRAVHGTSYDPASSVDRRKMERIRSTAS